MPIDGTTLTPIDRTGEKGFGVVGPHSAGAPGVHLMSAMAVDTDGTPLGLCGQQWWTRKKRIKRRHNDRRPMQEKESYKWVPAMDAARKAFDEEKSATRLWFQLDRGGDAVPVHLDGFWNRDKSWVTVRASHSRRLAGEINGKRQYLWPYLARQPIWGSYDLPVPEAPKRKARMANMVLQSCQVTLRLVDIRRNDRPFAITVWAVRAREVGTTPTGEAPIEWLLLTTFPVHTVEDAVDVLCGYATRWKIECWHRTWKYGACRIEESQLRSVDHFIRWATIMASVAMRIERLTHAARNTPELPATVELSTHEVEAVILLKKPKGVKRTDIPTIAQAVRWIADLGGYTGKSSGGRPGATVIARGLARIEPVAQVLSDGEEL